VVIIFAFLDLGKNISFSDSLLEPSVLYNAHFEVKKDDIEAKNNYFWNVNQ